MSVYTR